MSATDAMDGAERQHLAGEYVLGSLSGAERERVRQLIDTDAEMARAVADWQERLLPLTALAEPIDPPPRVWSRLQQTLNLAPPSPLPLRWWQWGWNSLPLWRGLAVASLAAVAVLGTVALQNAVSPAPRYVVVLVAPQDKAPGWVIQATDRQQVNLIPLGRVEVPADKSLQFWTKADDWSGPVSLGLVQPGASIRIPLDKLPPLQPNQLFELTLEPANGSPIGRPTGPIQYIGRAVPVT